MYLNLFGSSDRLGGNIGDIISQLLYAFNNNIFILYNRTNLRVYNSYNQSYNNTIFLKTIFDIIDFHNEKIVFKNFENEIDLSSPTHYTIWSKTLLNLKMDFFSYFKKNIYSDEFKQKFIDYGKKMNYEIPFDTKKTILIHLRLEDVKGRPDYDGQICANHFRNYIEGGNIPDVDFDLKFRLTHNDYNNQAPLNPIKIQKIISKILDYKPNHEIIIVTNPGEYIPELPYRYISNTDPCYDLFLLCNCETVILSRSNFALSSLFFGIATDVYIPLWGSLTCLGLYTKFDNTNFKYFS